MPGYFRQWADLSFFVVSNRISHFGCGVMYWHFDMHKFRRFFGTMIDNGYLSLVL